MSVHVNIYQYISIYINAYQYISIYVSTCQYISIHINAYQYISIHVNTYQSLKAHLYFVINSWHWYLLFELHCTFIQSCNCDLEIPRHQNFYCIWHL